MHRKGQIQAMDMGVHYELGAIMGRFLGLILLGEIISQHVQKKSTKRAENYVEGGKAREASSSPSHASFPWLMSESAEMKIWLLSAYYPWIILDL